jgi:hypothetical protein
MSQNLNIFTCCNGIYKDFIPLFIYSNIYHNNDCFVEIGVDVESYSEIMVSLKILEKYYKNKFKLYPVKFDEHEVNGKKYGIIPNTVRFLTTPTVKTEYIYISDIDIINLEKNISSIHIKNMEKTKLPYSNIVRPSKNRLSGLHFTKYSNYYPIPEYQDLCESGLLNHDEVFLYELVKKKYPNFNYNEKFRPVHGIHVSLNRKPNGLLGWGMKNWKNQWIEFRNSKVFVELYPTFTKMIKEKINIIDKFYK